MKTRLRILIVAVLLAYCFVGYSHELTVQGLNHGKKQIVALEKEVARLQVKLSAAHMQIGSLKKQIKMVADVRSKQTAIRKPTNKPRFRETLKTGMTAKDILNGSRKLMRKRAFPYTMIFADQLKGRQDAHLFDEVERVKGE